MKKSIFAAIFIIAATIAAKGQKEAYIHLKDISGITKDNSSGIILEGAGRLRAFMFNPAQARVYFMPLDTADNRFQLIDSMIPDGAYLVVQYFNAANRTRSLPEVVRHSDIPNLPPFTLSDGDLIVVELRQTPTATTTTSQK